MATNTEEDQLLYILADRVDGKYYHFYTPKDKRYAYCIVRNTAGPASHKDILTLDLLDIAYGWKPSVDYDIIEAASVHRQLGRCKGNFVIVSRNLVGLCDNSACEIFWTKGVLAESKLFTITRRDPKEAPGIETAVEWDHTKQLTCLYTSMSRDWADQVLEAYKQDALKGIRATTHYESVMRSAPTLSNALAHESVTSLLLKLERAFFDYAYHKHLMGDQASTLKALVQAQF